LYTSGWSNWEITPTSGMIYGTPRAVSPGTGKLDVMVIDDATRNVLDVKYDGHWKSYDTGVSATCNFYPTIATQKTGVAAFVDSCAGEYLLGAAYYNGQWNAVQSLPASLNGEFIYAAQAGNTGVRVIYTDPSTTGYVFSQNWRNTYFDSGYGYVPEWLGTSVNDKFLFVLGAVAGVDGPAGLSPPTYVFGQKADHSIWFFQIPAGTN
jgi:hypothetical protein